MRLGAAADRGRPCTDPRLPDKAAGGPRQTGATVEVASPCSPVDGMAQADRAGTDRAKGRPPGERGASGGDCAALRGAAPRGPGKIPDAATFGGARPDWRPGNLDGRRS